MGRIKTAAAKKYHEKESKDGNDDENLANLKRTTRPKRGATVEKSNASPRVKASVQPSRGTRSSAVAEKVNGKNGALSNKSSDASSEDEAPVVKNQKRKSSVEDASPKKKKPSTSAEPSKSKKTGKSPKGSKQEKMERYEASLYKDILNKEK